MSGRPDFQHLGEAAAMIDRPDIPASASGADNSLFDLESVIALGGPTLKRFLRRSTPKRPISTLRYVVMTSSCSVFVRPLASKLQLGPAAPHVT
jgi:hypothetical protein